MTAVIATTEFISSDARATLYRVSDDQGTATVAVLGYHPHPARVAVATAYDLGEIIDGTHSSVSTTRTGGRIAEAGANRYRVTR